MLGIGDKALGASISDKAGYTCSWNAAITEMIRGIRNHFTKFSKKLDDKTIK